MKALVLKDYHELVYEDAAEPVVGPDEVMIEVKACGICGSDVHGLDGSTGRRRPPLVMGHEAAGAIAEVGARVTGWRQGDRVTFDSTIYCGTCHYCRAGRINLCDNRCVLGVSCEEYRRQGAFAEYVAVPQRILYRLPGGLSFERAAMVEPLSIAFHAARRASASLSETAVVIGSGVIGLLAIQLLRAAGCAPIVAVDVAPDKLELARKLGADEALDAKVCDVAEEAKRITGGRGADLAIEAVGLPATVLAAVNCLRKGGALALIGNLSAAVELPLQTIVTREIALYGSCASCGEYAACLDLIARAAVDVDALTSAVAPLAEGAEWFARLYGKEAGLMKVILRP